MNLLFNPNLTITINTNDANGNTNLQMNSNTNQAQSNQPRYIFIDGGANRGDTFLLLLNNGTFFHPSIPRRDIDVYLFEASPIWNDILYQYFNKYPQIKHVYSQTGICANTEKLIFFMHPDNHEGSSAFVKTVNSERIVVDCIDICEWMIYDMKFSKNDHVIIKLDIEGGEYPIMKRIWEYPNDECISLIDEMFIEWHPWGQQPWNDTKEHHYSERGKEWKGKFVSKGVKMHHWD